VELFHERLEVIKDALASKPLREPNPSLFAVKVGAVIVQPTHVEQVDL
jgi:hypothetical protein